MIAEAHKRRRKLARSLQKPVGVFGLGGVFVTGNNPYGVVNIHRDNKENRLNRIKFVNSFVMLLTEPFERIACNRNHIGRGTFEKLKNIVSLTLVQIADKPDFERFVDFFRFYFIFRQHSGLFHTGIAPFGI